jgi:hypothetical protein
MGTTRNLEGLFSRQEMPVSKLVGVHLADQLNAKSVSLQNLYGVQITSLCFVLFCSKESQVVTISSELLSCVLLLVSVSKGQPIQVIKVIQVCKLNLPIN